MPIQSKQQPPYYTPTNGIVKTYKAICTQTGTNPPVAQILTNTLDLPDLQWFYDATGSFSFGEFPENLKLFVLVTGNSTVGRILNAGDDTNQYIVVKNTQPAGGTANDITFNILIEIHP